MSRRFILIAVLFGVLVGIVYSVVNLLGQSAPDAGSIIRQSLLFGVLGAAFVGAILGLILLLNRPVTNVTNAFMQALKDGDYPTAFAMAAPNFQKLLGSAERLQALIAENNVSLASWNWNSFQMTGRMAIVTASIILTDDTRGTALINLLRGDGGWQIVSCDIVRNAAVGALTADRSFSGRMKTGKRILLIVIGIAALGGVIAGFVLLLGKPVTDTSNQFLQALKESDYPAAFALFSPNLQAQLVSAEALQTQITENDVIPASWRLNGFDIENGAATVTGSVTFTDHKSGSVLINLFDLSGTWKITGYDIEPG